MADIQRDKLVEIGVFGLLGGVSGASIALLWVAGFKSEHIFALAGALIGAAATVGGAIWLADRNARIEQEREVAVLTADLEMLVTDAEKVVNCPIEPGTAWTDDLVDLLSELRSKLRGSRFVTAQAVQSSRGLNFRQRAACAGINEVIVTAEKIYDDMTTDDHELTDEDAEMLRGNAQLIAERTRDAVGYVKP